MKTFHVNLGRGLKVDVLKLVESRVGICANSGAGKTFLMRLLIERINGRIPVHVIDWEGEYHTLRSAIDAVYVAKGGDIAPQEHTAAKLAHKLVEKRVSAILDVSSLPRVQRLNFIGAYLEGLLDVPSKLWTPILVCIDEAHRVCPETASKGGGKNLISAIHRARAAVIALMDSGRKRGMGGVLVSQRIAKVAKDALGEGNNKFFGRFVQDTDVKRVGDDLGLDRRVRDGIKRLADGEFYAQGTALADRGKTYRFQAYLPKTKAPKFGESFVASRPSKTMKKVLADLASLPEEVDKEIRDLKEAKATIKKLEREVAQLKRSKGKKQLPSPEALVRAEEQGVKKATKAFEIQMRPTKAILKRFHQYIEAFKNLGVNLDEIRAQLETTLAYEPPIPTVKPSSNVLGLDKVFKQATELARRELDGPPQEVLPFSWKSAPGKLLTVMLQYHPETLGQPRAAALAGLNYRSSTFRNAVSKLRTTGFIDGFVLTPEGATYKHNVPALPSGEELIDGWRQRLGNGTPRRVFEALIDANGVADADVISTAAEAEGSTLRNAFSKLRTYGLLCKGTRPLKLEDHVLEALGVP